MKYRIPAEWEPHEGTWLQWPHNGTILPDYSEGRDYREQVEGIWIQMTKELHIGENVHIIVDNNAEKDHVTEKLSEENIDFNRVDFLVKRIDDVWVRDNGPIFVWDDQGNQVITDWSFNGWGGRMPHEFDAQVSAYISEHTNLLRVVPGIRLEGGGIEVDGRGSFMAAKTSIINDNRNPGKSQAEIEAEIAKYFGVTNFVWITGLSGDDPGGEMTDFHIDGAARFTGSNTILYEADPYGESEPHMLKTYDMHYNELRNCRDIDGNPFRLVPVPLTRLNVKGLDYKGSYLNYYIGNEVVLVPTYGDENDAVGLQIIEGQFPGRRIAGIDVCPLFPYGGMIHCVTQQQLRR
ncbi:MAG: agmatine deiminase family protein [Clostridiales bacterium]|nr:agmatine deiminase family protein [Clostridiales bacterium]